MRVGVALLDCHGATVDHHLGAGSGVVALAFRHYSIRSKQKDMKEHRRFDKRSDIMHLHPL